MHLPVVLCWNPINVVEGEGKWMAYILGLFFVSWAIMLILRSVIRQIESTSKAPYVKIAVETLYTPFVSLIWFLAILFSLDRVTEHLFSEQWRSIFSGVVKSALSLTFGWFLFRYKNNCLSYLVRKKKGENPERAELLMATSKIISVIIVFLVLLLLHDATGLNLTAILAFGGVGGLAVAFASQEVVQNFFGGFMLHIMRPFFHGESIEVPQATGAGRIEGSVDTIGWYQTTVRSQERETLYVPNSVFIRACVVNKSRTKGKLLDFAFHIEMPKAELFRKFCGALEDKLRSMEEIYANERISVWIKNMYGHTAEIGVFAILRSKSTEQLCRAQTDLFIEIQKLAEGLGGTLTFSLSYLEKCAKTPDV